MCINSLSVQKKRRSLATLLLGVASVLVLGTSGCDDPFALDATEENQTDTLSVFAMTGTAAFLPSAYNADLGSAMRIDPDLNFDVAFDVDGQGKVRVIPVRLVSALRQGFPLPTSTQQVGLQVSASTFDQVTRAPNRGYKIDSVVVVSPGQPVVMEVVSDACQFVLAASTRYHKFVIDSVTASRQIHFRTVRNLNCGFRSFLPGVPKN
jgi:hypothetical protein